MGTAIGGISGPLLFGHLINSKDEGLVSIAVYIGAGVMILAGVVEIFLGVKAEGAKLEDLAQPLTVDDDSADDTADDGDDGGDEGSEDSDEHASSDAPARRCTPWMSASAPTDQGALLDREIEAIARAVAEQGTMTRSQLASSVNARAWAPGRFAAAVREAIADGRVVALSGRRLEPDHAVAALEGVGRS